MNAVVKKIAVLIPSYHPEGILLSYVEKLEKIGFAEIVIVDDGSTKGTWVFDKLKEKEHTDAGVTVLCHEKNRGKGRALKTGFAYLLEKYKPEELQGVVTADADGQHSLEDTVKVAEKLAEEGSFVLGTRDFSLEQVPAKSRFGNHTTTVVFSLLYGKRIQDTQTGLRGIPYRFLETCLTLPGERFDYEIRMLIQAVRERLPITEVPIETIYYDGNRETHFHAIKDSLRIYKILFGQWFRFIGSSLLSFVLDMALFQVLLWVLPAKPLGKELIVVATYGARAVSSLFNYFMNRRFVFANSRKASHSLWRYYLLCVLQATLSGILVTVIHFAIGGGAAQASMAGEWTTLIKLIVDVCLFLVSYQIQRIWVFADSKNIY